MAPRKKSPNPPNLHRPGSAAMRERLEIETPRTRKAAAAVLPETAERWLQDASQPQQWSWPSERRLLTTRIPRLDGAVKATGAARYSYDVNLPRMLYGKMLRSPHAHARIVSIDTSAAQSAPGVMGIHTIAAEGGTLRYHGDPIAAVAAETEEQARDARRLIDVEYDILPHVASEEDAMARRAPLVHEDSNVRPSTVREEGDLEAAFAAADVVYGGDFRTQVETHSSLETHGVVARWDGNDLTVWASTQGVHSVKSSLAGYFEMPETQVHVRTPYMGGGFGSKLGSGVEDAVAAILARETGRPVKLLLERDEEHLDTGNRPSSVARVRAGATRDGKLIAYEALGYGTGGITSGAGMQLPYVYTFPNSRRQTANVYINAGNQRAMRAPGHPQGAFLMEGVMDELAAALEMDPVAFRKLNVREDSLWTDQLDIGAEAIGWADNWHPPGDPTPGPIKKGMGCAAGLWGTGGGSTRATCSIHPDGSVQVTCGTQDIGTGTRTVVAIVAAEILGLEVEDITVNIGNSDYPYSGSSGGSTTVPSVAPAVRVTAGMALDALFERLAPQLGVAADQLEARVGSIGVAGDASQSWSWQQACQMLGTEPISVDGQWQPGLSSRGVNGAQFASVSVDIETGVVTVDKIVAVHDCGMVVDLLTTESQVNGGVIMGLGYGLFEERILDRPTGRMVNPNFERYNLPGPSDIPDIDVHMMDVPARGTLGIGEPPAIPTAAAIANAVSNAIGVRIHSIPITPEKVIAALEEGPQATLKPPRFDLLEDAIEAAEGREGR